MDAQLSVLSCCQRIMDGCMTLADEDEVESAREFNRPLSSGNRTVRKDASPLTLFIHINKDLIK